MQKRITTHITKALMGSVVLHAVFIGSIIYASMHNRINIGSNDKHLISAVMIDPGMFAVSKQSTQTVAKPMTPPASEITPPPEKTNVPESTKKVETQPKPITKKRVVKQKKAITEKKQSKKHTTKTKHDRKITDKPNTTGSKPLATSSVQNTTSSVASPMSSHPARGAMARSMGKPRALSQRAPVYPPRAQNMNREGQVKVKFDVSDKGKVKNIEIISATPKNLFERSVIKAMKTWRYEKRSAKGLHITIIFKLNGQAEIQ